MRSNRYFEWKDGVPVPAGRDALTKRDMENIQLAALATSYIPMTRPIMVRWQEDGKWKEDFQRDDLGEVMREIDPSEYRFRNADGSWMSNYEVVNLRRIDAAAKGDLEAAKQIDERLLGKPKQSLEQTTITGTFQEWLSSLAKETLTITVDAESVARIEQDDMDWL